MCVRAVHPHRHRRKINAAAAAASIGITTGKGSPLISERTGRMEGAAIDSYLPYLPTYLGLGGGVRGGGAEGERKEWAGGLSCFAGCWVGTVLLRIVVGAREGTVEKEGRRPPPPPPRHNQNRGQDMTEVLGKACAPGAANSGKKRFPLLLTKPGNQTVLLHLGLRLRLRLLRIRVRWRAWVGEEMNTMYCTVL